MRKVVAKRIGNQERCLPAGQEVTIAVDLSRTKWVYACRWSGQEQRRLSTPGTSEHLEKLVQEYLDQGCVVRVVYEACGFGYRLAWRLAEQGADVQVVAPSTIEKAPGSQVKTDGLDASQLAFRHEKGLLKGIYIPDAEHHDLRQLSRTYEQMIGDRRKQQARLRLVLQEHGYTDVPDSSQGWSVLERWIAQQEFGVGLAICVQELLLARKNADECVQRLKKEIDQVGRLPRYSMVAKALAKQSGVGRLTAIRFVLEVGSIGRFATAGSLPNYLGLTPGEYSSGDTVHRGHVRKCGPGRVRAWLIQCAWVAVRTRKDTALVESYDRLAPRVGKKRAIVAVARKLALRLRARWIGAETRQEAIAA